MGLGGVSTEVPGLPESLGSEFSFSAWVYLDGSTAAPLGATRGVGRERLFERHPESPARRVAEEEHDVLVRVTVRLQRMAGPLQDRDAGPGTFDAEIGDQEAGEPPHRPASLGL